MILRPPQKMVALEGGKIIMDTKEFFIQLRDISGDIVTALDNEDVDTMETAMGKFMVLMLKMDALK